jgi:hypothetical protein
MEAICFPEKFVDFQRRNLHIHGCMNLNSHAWRGFLSITTSSEEEIETVKFAKLYDINFDNFSSKVSFIIHPSSPTDFVAHFRPQKDALHEDVGA